MRKTLIFAGLMALGAAAAPAQQPPPARPAGDPMAKFFYPPELVLSHQQAINLSDRARGSIEQALKETQAKMVEVQVRMSGEAEKLAKLIEGPTVDEARVLEQVDHVLALERDMKRAQFALMVRIKNALTPEQQSALDRFRSPGRAEDRSPEP